MTFTASRPAPKPAPRLPKTRKPLPRSTKPIARSRMKRSNPKRREANFKRSYGDRLAWIKAWSCMTHNTLGDDCEGPIDAAHTKNGGMGRKADASTLIPLCRKHHRAVHQYGAKTFEATHRVSLEALAAQCDRAYQRHVAESGGVSR